MLRDDVYTPFNTIQKPFIIWLWSVFPLWLSSVSSNILRTDYIELSQTRPVSLILSLLFPCPFLCNSNVSFLVKIFKEFPPLHSHIILFYCTVITCVSSHLIHELLEKENHAIYFLCLHQLARSLQFVKNLTDKGLNEQMSNCFAGILPPM